MCFIENNIKLGKNLLNIIPNYNPYDLNDPNIIFNLSYFCNWFVGFTMAECSFLNKKNNEALFSISQKYFIALTYAILNLFNLNKKIYFNKKNFFNYKNVFY